MKHQSREEMLAKIIVSHSLDIKPQEKVLITVSNPHAFLLAKAVFIETLRIGAYPLMDESTIPGLSYNFYNLANKWQLGYVPKEVIKAKINWADAFVRIFSEDNSKELSQIDPKIVTKRTKLIRPISDKIVDSDRWLLTEFPSHSMAQQAGISLDWLTNFYYDACLVDYKKMEQQLLGLQKIMDAAKDIHIVGDQTDLTLSATGRLSCACFGQRNIPDGEVFLAPVKNSLNGKIYFEFPTEYLNHDMEGVYLEFKNGKVIKAKADKGEAYLHKILETDAGAKFAGEFAIGANYSIKQGLRNTLFDEKIGGTVHLALGRSYKEARGGAPVNGNNSAIHWDLVKDTRIKGSFVEVDGEKILVDGKIV